MCHSIERHLLALSPGTHIRRHAFSTVLTLHCHFQAQLHLRKVEQGMSALKAAGAQEVRAEGDVSDMTAFLDSLKYNDAGLVAAIVQVPCPMPYPAGPPRLQRGPHWHHFNGREMTLPIPRLPCCCRMSTRERSSCRPSQTAPRSPRRCRRAWRHSTAGAGRFEPASLLIVAFQELLSHEAAGTAR